MNTNFCIKSVNLNVKDLKSSVKFYEELLGNGNSVDSIASFKLKDSDLHISQITSEEFDIGEGFSGIGISTIQPIDLLPNILNTGVEVVQEFGDYHYGASMIPDEDEMKPIPVRYGVFSDPSGFNIEIKESANRECKIVLGVIDLDESIEFYSTVLNMNILRKRSNTHNHPREASMCAHMSYDNSEADSTYIELLYRYGTEDVLNLGTGLQKLVVSASDLSQVVAQLQEQGQAFAVAGDGSLALTDPNGYQISITQR